MSGLLGAALGISVAAGLILIVAGLTRRPPPPARPTSRALKAPTQGRIYRVFFAPTRRARANRRLALAGLAAGLVVAVLFGWVIGLILFPAALVGVPMLLFDTRGRDEIRRVEGLEEWVRTLAAIVATGHGLEQAIASTVSRSTPEPIAVELRTLVARLRSRWSTRDALRAFADELNDATADNVVAGLIVAVGQRGPGLTAMLESTAERAAEDSRNRRRIEADYASPRFVARFLTGLTIAAVVIGPLSPSFMEPYTTPAGQAVLLVLLAVDVALLLWMRKISQGEPRPRVLVDDGQGLVRTTTGSTAATAATGGVR